MTSNALIFFGYGVIAFSLVKILSNFLHIARTKSKELEDVITDFEYSNEVFNDVNFYDDYAHHHADDDCDRS